MAERQLVKNAADPKQVRRAERTQARRERLFLEAMHEVMATTAGRLVFWELLERAGIYESVWDQSGSLMSLKEGRRQMGLEVIALINQADPSQWILMEREARMRKDRQDADTDAALTPPAEVSGG